MCIFPTGESGDGKKLKTSHAEFTTHRLPRIADEPHIGLGVTSESPEVMRMPRVPRMTRVFLHYTLKGISCVGKGHREGL